MHHATTWELRVAGVAKAFTDLCINLGQPGAAVDDLPRLQAAPLNGDVVAALVRAHVEPGVRSAAEHVYQEHAAHSEQADPGDLDPAIEELR